MPKRTNRPDAPHLVVVSKPIRTLVHELRFTARSIEVFGDSATADVALQDITYELARADQLSSYRVLDETHQVRAARFRIPTAKNGRAALVFRESAETGVLYLMDVYLQVATRGVASKECEEPICELQLLLRLSLLMLELQRLVQAAAFVAPHLTPGLYQSAAALELLRGAPPVAT